MSEKFVYAISPDYMMPMIVESKMYSFYVKAYHNARVAYENLCKTNLSSILGFILFYEELPDNLTYIIKFINFINVIGTKDTLVILAVNDPEGVTDFLIPKLKVDNISFKYITGFEVVTDSFIKKSLYGSVVLHNFDPYIENISPYKEITSFNSNVALTPILSNDVISILSPVVKLNNSENTIKHDLVMNSPTESNLMLYMRINYIRASFGEEIDEEGMISRIKALDGINVIVYKSIISIMKRLIVSYNLNRSNDLFVENEVTNLSEPSMLLDLDETVIEYENAENSQDDAEDDVDDFVDKQSATALEIKEELLKGELLKEIEIKTEIEPENYQVNGSSSYIDSGDSNDSNDSSDFVVPEDSDDYYANAFNYSEEDEVDDLDIEDDLNRLNI